MSGPTGVVLHLSSGAVLRGVRAVIFDCDGVLVDSESVWLDMLAQWHGRRGLDGGDLTRFAGLTAEDTARRLLDGHRAESRESADDDVQLAQLTAELNTTYSSLLHEGVAPMPGAVELVTDLACRLPVAVASNGRRIDVESMLDGVGILPRLRGVATVDDVARGKPDPELYLRAADQLGVSPQDCAAFEDSPAGSEAAASAGMMVVGVNPSAEVSLSGHHRLHALTEITVDEEGPR